MAPQTEVADSPKLTSGLNRNHESVRAAPPNAYITRNSWTEAGQNGEENLIASPSQPRELGYPDVGAAIGDQGQLLQRLAGALQTGSNLAGPAVLELPVGKTATTECSPISCNFSS